MEETKMITLRKVPEALHREIKAAAALAGKTQEPWILEAIREKLERVREDRQARGKGRDEND